MKFKFYLSAKKTISFFVTLILIGGCMLSGTADIDVDAVTTTYQASDSYNDGLGIQGKDQWYCQQWNGSSYADLTYNNSAQTWYGTQTYLAVNSVIMHPEASLDAVRKWVAPCNGSARIYGNVRKADTGGGDGVRIAIKQNSTLIWGAYDIAYNDSTGLNHDVTRDVKAGDAIYFLVSKYGNIYNDSTYWDPYIDFTPLASGTNVIPYEFTSSVDGWNNPYSCTISASGGYLNGTVTATAARFLSPDNLNTDITKNGIIKIRMKNSTSATWAAFYFITNDDTTYTQAKCKAFTINANDANYTEYTVDMSGVYGWIGKLKQVQIYPSGAASSGTFSIDYIRFQNGGSNSPAFSLLDKQVVCDTNTLVNVKGLDVFPDSSIGIVRNSDASYKFLTAQGGGATGSNVTVTSGTLDNPVNTIVGETLTVANAPGIYSYVSAGPTYRDPSDSNTLMSFSHLERHYTYNGSDCMYASLGIIISTDGGSSWTWCGEIIRPKVAYDSSSPYSYDIGAGTYIIQNVGGVDYFYVYAIDHNGPSPYKSALSVSRASVSSVLAAAKNHTVTSWYKFYNSAWNEPGLNGNFTDIFNPNAQMNFMSVSYNSYADKYLLAYCSTYQWGTDNWSDISLLVADSPTDFYNNTDEYIIDPGKKYAQYPTIVGLGNSNSETETQKNFYVYYTQWDNDSFWWGGNPCICRKMVILD